MKYLQIKKISNSLIGLPVVYRKHWDDEANRNGWKGEVVAVRSSRITIAWTLTPHDRGNVKRQEYDASAIINAGHDEPENYIHIIEQPNISIELIIKGRAFDFHLDDKGTTDYTGFTCTIAWEDEEEEYLANLEYNIENSGHVLLNLTSVSCDFLGSKDLLSINEVISGLELQLKNCDRWVVEEGDLIFMDTRTYGIN